MSERNRTASNANTPSWTAQLWDLEPELRAHALRLAGSRSRADDLVQDTMERALRFSSQFRPGTNMRGWTHRILHNQFISTCRKHARERRLLQRVAVDPSWRKSRTGDPLLGLGLTVATRDALDALPEHYRRTLCLVDLGDMSYQEAAEQLRVPVGTIMSRLHRARRLLAKHLSTPDSLETGRLAA